MTLPKTQVYISTYVTKTKEEAIDKTPIFKAQIRDKKIRARRLDIKELNDAILGGRTVNFGAVNIKTLMAIDIDNKGTNKVTLERLIEILKKINCSPVLFYESLSSTQDNPRYRVIIKLDEPIADDQAYTEILRGLINYINLFYPESADITTCAVNTIFYPCQECLYKNTNSLSSLESLKKLACIVNHSKILEIDLTETIVKSLVKTGIPESLLRNNLRSKKYLFLANYRVPYICPILDIDKKTKDNLERFYRAGKAHSNTLSLVLQCLESIDIPMFKAVIRTKQKMIKKIETGVFPTTVHFNTKELLSDIFSGGKEAYGKLMIMDDGNEIYCSFRIENKKPVLQKKYNVIDLLMLLMNAKDMRDLEERLYKFCNVKLYTNTINSLKANVSAYENGILTSICKYEYLSKMLISMNNSCGKYVLLTILNEAQKHLDSLSRTVDSKEKCLDPQIIVPIRFIVNTIKEKYNIDYTEAMVSKYVNLLIKLGLVTYINPEDYSSYIKSIISKAKYKTYNVYMTPYYNLELLKAAEKNAKDFIKKGSSFSSLKINHSDKLLKSPIYVAADKYIKKMFIFEKYIFQTDVVHYLADHFPDRKITNISKDVSTYKEHLAQDNNFDIVKLTTKSIKKYGVSKQAILERKIQVDRTNIFVKE